MSFRWLSRDVLGGGKARLLRCMHLGRRGPSGSRAAAEAASGAQRAFPPPLYPWLLIRRGETGAPETRQTSPLAVAASRHVHRPRRRGYRWHPPADRQETGTRAPTPVRKWGRCRPGWGVSRHL